MMRFFRPRLPTGYDEETYASPYLVVRYPHQVRFRTAVEALVEAQPVTLLDYGAGDGRLLIESIHNGLQARRIVAYEPVELFANKLLEMIEEHRLEDRITVVRDRDVLHREAFDYITCLSVLEHLPLPERYAFYNLCRDSLSPAGRVLIDVPVEVGPTLLIKNLGRLLLKGREKEYEWRELCVIAAGRTVYDPGRFDPSDGRTCILGHKGFDYRLLRRELAYRFSVTEEETTPLPFLCAPLGNQEVFFTVKRREESRRAEAGSAPDSEGASGPGGIGPVRIRPANAAGCGGPTWPRSPSRCSSVPGSLRNAATPIPPDPTATDPHNRLI